MRTKTNQLQPSNTSNHPYLKLTNAEYQKLLSDLDNAYHPKKTFINERIDVQDYLKQHGVQNDQRISKKQLVPLDLAEVVTKNESIINKHKVLKGFMSMMSVYHQALLTKDKTTLKKLTETYKTFLVYLPKVNFAMLNRTHSHASMLSPEGLIEIDNKIYQYGIESLKVIENGDPKLIDSLSKINASTKQVSVHNYAEKKSSQQRAGSASPTPQPTSFVLVNPDDGRYAVGMVKVAIYDGGNGLNSIYKLGTGAASFFSFPSGWAPVAVNVFVLQSYVSYPGPVGVYGNWIEQNVLINTGLIYNAALIHKKYPESSSNKRFLDMFSITSVIGVQYTNLVTFFGIHPWQ